ncbi:PASTA domain-containing protein [bacterium]|nr:PASTA domain-containing protein [bacterium]
MARSRRKSSTSTDKAGCLGAISIIVLVIVAVAIVVLIYQTFSGGLGQPRETVLVPDLRRMTIEDATKVLAAKNLRLVKGEPIFSDDIEIGKIVVQDFLPNQVVKEGRRITVRISKGPNFYIVPNVVNMNLAAAQTRLKQTHLYAGRVEKILNPNLDEGVIVSQYPEAGEKMPASSGVDLVVSVKSTDETVEMPDLVGLMLTNAEGMLATRNLPLMKVKYKPHPGIEYGQVVSQAPPAGRMITLGTPVTLEVAIDVDTFSSLVKQFRVRLKIPKGPESQEVTVIIEDRLGESEVYSQRYRVGQLVSEEFKAEGDATMRIYLDGRLIREDVIQ